MANIFAKAASAAKVEPQGKKDDAIIVTPDDDSVRQAIDDLAEAKGRKKEAETDEKAAQQVASAWCRQKWISMFAEKGTKPDNFKVKGVKTVGHYLIQSRCGNYNVTDEQFTAIKAVVGDETAEQLVSETTKYAINEDILNKEGVANAISTALEGLVKKGILKADELERLIEAKPKRVFKDNVAEQVATLCGNDKEKMTLFIDALGSNITAYVK